VTPELNWDFDRVDSDVLINIYPDDAPITTSISLPIQTAKKFALDLLQNVLIMENTRDV